MSDPIRELRAAVSAEPPAPDPHDVLAVRPLLEAVVALEVYNGPLPALQQRISAWLAENPPGQPVAIEPRGCPAPGACSCVEPPAPEADAALSLAAIIRQIDGSNSLGAAELADAILLHPNAASVFQPPAPAPVVEEDDGDDVISRWIDGRPCWPNDWPAVTQCQLTALIGEALEHWGRPATPPAPAPDHFRTATEMVADGERKELADRLGWIAAQLADIGWGDDSASVARAAALLRELETIAFAASEQQARRQEVAE